MNRLQNQHGSLLLKCLAPEGGVVRLDIFDAGVDVLVIFVNVGAVKMAILAGDREIRVVGAGGAMTVEAFIGKAGPGQRCLVGVVIAERAAVVGVLPRIAGGIFSMAGEAMVAELVGDTGYDGPQWCSINETAMGVIVFRTVGFVAVDTGEGDVDRNIINGGVGCVDGGVIGGDVDPVWLLSPPPVTQSIGSK